MIDPDQPPPRSVRGGLYHVASVVDEDGLPVGQVYAPRLWVAGIAIALVTALTAAVGVLLVRGVLHIDAFNPGHRGTVDHLDAGILALYAALASVVATGLMYVLLRSSLPRPLLFFYWLVALLTVLVMLTPFTSNAQVSVKVTTAAVYLALGLEIGLLLPAITKASVLQSAVVDPSISRRTPY